MAEDIQMRRSTRIIRLLGGLAAFSIHTAFAASRVDIAPITFSAPLIARLHNDLGDEEIPALQQLVSSAVNKSIGSKACGKALRIQIQIEDAAPTHPTRWEMANDPSIDFLHSRSVGGADLTGRLLGADGRALATVSYRRYAPDIRTTSVVADAWADARLTVDQFASELAGACRAQEDTRAKP
jgi:hypothetical protein